MFCRNCGNDVSEHQEVCLKCGVRPLAGGKHCQNCGVEVTSQQELCIKCGVRLVGGVSTSGKKMINPAIPPKNPATAAILAFLITGVGQIYLGQTLKGIAMLIGAIFGSSRKCMHGSR